MYTFDAGGGHNCAAVILMFTFKYGLLCWGSDSHGQSEVPYGLKLNNKVVQSLSSGVAHTCVVYKTNRNYNVDPEFDNDDIGEGQYDTGDTVMGENVNEDVSKIRCWGL